MCILHLSITIHSGLKTKILEAQSEASKDLKALTEWLRRLERHFEQRDVGEIYFFDCIWIPSVGGFCKEIDSWMKLNTSRYSVLSGAKDVLRVSKIKDRTAETLRVSSATEFPELIIGKTGETGEIRQRFILPMRCAETWCTGVNHVSPWDGRFHVTLMQASSGKCGVRVLDCVRLTTPSGPERSEVRNYSDAGGYASSLFMDFGWRSRDIVLKVDESQAYGPENYARNDRKDVQINGKILWDLGAYRTKKLPQELSCVHDTFHVSNHKKCLAEPDIQVPLDEIEIDENLCFVEEFLFEIVNEM
ncbi:hypothetical protein Tco_0410121 [Tanacetum coccineum]